MPTLFEPYTLNNGVHLKNRLVVAPMTHFGSTPTGKISDEERRFLQHRATDFGLFITAATLVSIEGKAFFGQPHAIDESDLPSLKETAEILKQQGAKAVLQLHHGGKLANKQDQTGVLSGLDKLAPSDSAEHQARAATAEEVAGFIHAFANAADLALRAGFDGVEIHGANGYLLQQFFSGHSNQRTDQWGGSLENRLRFPLAVVDAIVAMREKHQRPDFIIGYRFSPEEPEALGITMADTFALIDALVQKPLQYLHVSLHDFYAPARRGADETRPRIAQIHQRIGGKLPLIGVGNLVTVEQVQAAFNTGWAEWIAVGKAVLANPNFATLFKNGEWAAIQTCIDPARKAFYAYPEMLWQFNLNGSPMLPPLKK